MFCKIVGIKIDINLFLANVYFESYDLYFHKMKSITFKNELDKIIFDVDFVMENIKKAISDNETYHIIVIKIFNNISNHITNKFNIFFKMLMDKDSLKPYFNAYLLRLCKIERQRNDEITIDDIKKQIKYFRDYGLQEFIKPIIGV